MTGLVSGSGMERRERERQSGSRQVPELSPKGGGEKEKEGRDG